MEFIQKKSGNKHTFHLHDDYFNFAYEDKSGSGDHDIHYADFPQKSSTQIEQNEWLKNVGYLWIAIGVFQIGYALYSDTSLSGKGFWLLLGALCVTWAQVTTVTYSVFRGDRGNVFVIKDAQHDQIIETLNSRRKDQLYRWYAEVNTDNDLEDEIDKYRWLVAENVMSQEEADLKIAEAEYLHREGEEGASASLN